MGRALALTWISVLLILTAGQGAAIARQAENLFRRIEAREAVRRIAENSFRYFEGRRPPSGDAFWKAIQREAPVLDPWGRAYSVEHRSDGGFLCRSAGEDRVRDTSDDIVFEVPFGLTLDMLQPEKTSLDIPPEQRVRDAK